MGIFAKGPLSPFQRAAKPFSLLESRGNSSERWQCREKRPAQHNVKVGVLFTPHEVFFFVDLEQFLPKSQCLAGSLHLTTTALLSRRGWPIVKWGVVNTGCKPHFNQSPRFSRQCGLQASLGLYKPTHNPRRISEVGTSTWLYTKEPQSL